MRQLLFIAFEFLWATVYSQPVTGKIIDADSKTPVEYVNIGVVGKNRGTVCDKDGSFSLLLDEKFDNETLRFSVVGYHPLSFNVADFKKAYRENIGGLIIELAKKTLILKEVFVSPLEFKDKKVGGKGKLGTVIFESNKDTSLGSEVGTVIKVKKAPAFVRDVNIVFTKNTYDDSILFRINIYSMNDKLPGENILKEPIYVSMNTKKGTLTVSLEKYTIYVENDFLVALEWIEVKGEKKIGFGMGLKGQSFMRNVSQGEWDKFPLGSIGIFATILYVK